MEIPLTSFIDFVIKSGSPKMTAAENIKKNLNIPYDPITDYYKRFREGVQEMHKSNRSKTELLDIIGALPDSKFENYNTMAAGYQKFLGKKEYTWIEPMRNTWRHNNIEVTINPEVGLKLGDDSLLVKLYLKADKPSKDRVASILALMKNAIQSEDWKYCLLDVRNATIYTYDTKMDRLLPLVAGEADSLSLILSKI